MGDIVTDNMTDDADILREIRSLFVRTYILIRRFYKCSTDVRRILFETYCVCVYDAALWSKFFSGVLLQKNGLKMFFKCCKDLHLPSFDDAILHNSSIIFSRYWNVWSIHSKIIGHLAHLEHV